MSINGTVPHRVRTAPVASRHLKADTTAEGIHGGPRIPYPDSAWERNPCVAVAAVPVRVLPQVLLVVVLGVVESGRRGDLGGDLAIPALGDHRRVQRLRALDLRQLVRRGVVDGGPVLRAPIRLSCWAARAPAMPATGRNSMPTVGQETTRRPPRAAARLRVSVHRRRGVTGPGAGGPTKLYARSDREFAVTVPPRGSTNWRRGGSARPPSLIPAAGAWPPYWPPRGGLARSWGAGGRG